MAESIINGSILALCLIGAVRVTEIVLTPVLDAVAYRIGKRRREREKLLQLADTINRQLEESKR